MQQSVVHVVAGAPARPEEGPMSEESREPGPARFAWQQLTTLVLGAAYVLLGMLGFFFLRDTSSASLVGHDTDDLMLGLELNAITNVVHLVMGIAGLSCTTTLNRARGYGVGLAVVGAVLFVFGVVAVGDPTINVLSLNWGDNILHLVTALVGLGIAVGPVRRAAEAPSG
jgi:hypothetical protein